MFPIISADQRLAERHGVKLVLLGFWGLGKTTQLKTLPEESTLFVDLEAGDLVRRHVQILQKIDGGRIKRGRERFHPETSGMIEQDGMPLPRGHRFGVEFRKFSFIPQCPL